MNQKRKLARATPDGRTIQVEDEKTVTPNNQRVFCDPRRRVWYDSDGKATVPMAGVDKLNAKVVEGPLQTGEKNSLTICLFQNKIIFEERAKQDKQTKAKESKENKHVIVSKEAKQAREDAEHIENCNRMYEYMKCATNHKDFNSLKKTSLEINKLKLTNKKRVIETQSQASSSKKSTTKLPATYAEYCR
ncbi:hypothetical protein LSTR_LSTR008938 [Laodelphax striatellus]|uniref:Uncharacterized protein n=1 Tax=Laodelphax striatellus TaxID=195883 RepID=A0A482WRF0_LAOST|nr:hypothetical protein LSTR_LSTR008938 [Laodelphax striatellus]